MNRNAYLIVKEFLDAPSATEQVRKNALAALAVLDDPEALEDLVRIVLNDPAPAVRERAELEIRSLPPKKLSAVLDKLHERIRARKDDQYRAYAELGRLRSQGVRVGTPRVSLARRITLARRPPEDTRFGRRSAVVRNLWASFRGAAGASIVFTLLIVMVFSLNVKSNDLFGFGFLSLAAGILVALCAVALTVPIGVQPDLLAAAAIDFGMVAMVSASASFLWSLSMTGSDRVPGAVSCVLLMLPAGMIALRAVMWMLIGSWRTHASNLWTAVCCGSAAGILVMSAFPILLKQSGNGNIGPLWVIAVPVFGALAMTFAVVDAQVPTHPVAPRFLRIASAVPLIVLAGFVIWIRMVSSAGTKYPPVADGGALEESHMVQISQVPGWFCLLDPAAADCSSSIELPGFAGFLSVYGAK